MPGRRTFALAALMSLVTASLASPAAAQADDWKPERLVRVLVNGAPGSGADTAMRAAVPHMEKFAGVRMVIENQVGGGGSVGVLAAARAQPDGHTLLAAVSGVLLNPLINPNTPYDLFRDVVPVSQVTRSTAALLVNNHTPAQSLKELADLARAQPGKLDMGNFGFGTSSHIQGVVLARRLGVDWQIVPFPSSPPLLRDMIAGHICCGISDLSSAGEFVRTRQLRALAVNGTARSPAMPDVPTFAELGITGLEAELFQGLYAPAGTPEKILNFWSRAVAYAVRQPEVIEILSRGSSQGVSSTPAEFAAFMRDQHARWKQVVDETGIRK